MIILGIDSSAVSAGCAVLKDGAVLSEGFVNVGLTHSQTLLPLITDTVKNAGIALSDVDKIAVSCGPGSFTGVRIGIATVKGLAFTHDIPCVGVSTLEGIAYGAIGIDGYVCAAMDARRDQVYNALFDSREGNISRMCEDRAISIADLICEVKNLDGTVWLCGDGAALCKEVMSRSQELEGRDIRLAPQSIRWQNGRSIALAALDREGIPPEKLLPSYLRPSQAERELKKRSENQPQ